MNMFAFKYYLLIVIFNYTIYRGKGDNNPMQIRYHMTTIVCKLDITWLSLIRHFLQSVKIQFTINYIFNCIFSLKSLILQEICIKPIEQCRHFVSIDVFMLYRNCQIKEHIDQW